MRGYLIDMKHILDNNKISYLYINKNMSIKEIAIVMNVSITPIIRCLKEMNIGVRKSYFRKDGKVGGQKYLFNIEEIKNLYDVENLTYKEIGHIFKCAGETIYHFCKKNGIKSRVAQNRKYRDLTKLNLRDRLIHKRSQKKLNGNLRRHRSIEAGELTRINIQYVYEKNIKKYGTLTCYLCLNPIEFGNDTLEHKNPLSRGGSNNHDNLEIACKKCNFKKNKKTVEEYNGGIK